MIATTKTETAGFTTAGKGDVVICYKTGAIQQILPVGINTVGFILAIQVLLCPGRTISSFTVRNKLRAVHHGVFSKYVLHTMVRIVTDAWLPVFAAFICCN